MERDTLSNRLRTAYWSLVAVGCGLMLSVRPVLAETIWDRFSSWGGLVPDGARCPSPRLRNRGAGPGLW